MITLICQYSTDISTVFGIIQITIIVVVVVVVVDDDDGDAVAGYVAIANVKLN